MRRLLLGLTLALCAAAANANNTYFGRWFCPESECLVSQGVVGVNDMVAFIGLQNIRPVGAGWLPGDRLSICNHTVCVDLVFQASDFGSGFKMDLKKGIYPDDGSSYRNDHSALDTCGALCWIAFGTPTLWDVVPIWVSPIGTVEIIDPPMSVLDYAGMGPDSGGVVSEDPWGDSTIPGDYWGGGACMICLVVVKF